MFRQRPRSRKAMAWIRANVRLANLLQEKLGEASIGGVETTSGIAVDVADIIHIGKRLTEKTNELLRLRFPRDLEKLEELLIGLQVDLLIENQWHLTDLKRELPRALRKLDYQLRGKGRPTRQWRRRKSKKK